MTPLSYSVAWVGMGREIWSPRVVRPMMRLSGEMRAVGNALLAQRLDLLFRRLARPGRCVSFVGLSTRSRHSGFGQLQSIQPAKPRTVDC